MICKEKQGHRHSRGPLPIPPHTKGVSQCTLQPALPPGPRIPPHQDELPVVGHLSGPARLGPVTLEQPLLTHHLVLALPPGQALQGDRGQRWMGLWELPGHLPPTSEHLSPPLGAERAVCPCARRVSGLICHLGSREGMRGTTRGWGRREGVGGSGKGLGVQRGIKLYKEGLRFCGAQGRYGGCKGGIKGTGKGWGHGKGLRGPRQGWRMQRGDGELRKVLGSTRRGWGAGR